MRRFYNIDLVDLYRGTLSVRHLGVLVRQLPSESRLSTALNEGQPVWRAVEHLLADIWAQTVRGHSAPDSLPKGFDHPSRVAITARAAAAKHAARRALFKQRQKMYGSTELEVG